MLPVLFAGDAFEIFDRVVKPVAVLVMHKVAVRYVTEVEFIDGAMEASPVKTGEIQESGFGYWNEPGRA